jgi:transcriptional antiterminator RfaH
LGGPGRAPEQASQWYADRGRSWAKAGAHSSLGSANGLLGGSPATTASDGTGTACLSLRGFETYCPRLRERRARHGQLHEVIKPLFVGYTFVLIQLQWHAAHWAPGTLGLIMDGDRPAQVPDNVIADLRARERNGAVELPGRARPGDRVRILRGPFRDRLALYVGMSGRDRVAVLLQLLGREHKVLLPRIDVEI